MDEKSQHAVPSLEELENEVEITVYQAGGPGGQHRNRTYSAVRVRHVPTGITVTCADTRSQLRNKRLALERLRRRLLERRRRRPPRVPTRKSSGVRERELAAKRRRGRLKKLRSDLDDA
jgi:ribosome-associated protein